MTQETGGSERRIQGLAERLAEEMAATLGDLDWEPGVVVLHFKKGKARKAA